MALHHVYADAPLSTIDITGRVRFGGTPDIAPGELVNPTSNAEEGSGATWRAVVDDLDASLVIIGWRRIYGYEDEAPVGKQVLYNGFVGDKEIDKGDLVEAPVVGRQWRVDLVDPNILLSWRLGNGADCNRPAETDLERIAWALTTTELNTLDPNADLIDTTGGVAMDACDYRGQPMQQLVDDCSQQSGRNAFVVYREDLDPNVYCLAYMKPESELYYAVAALTEDGIRLTNDAAEVDDSIPFGDTQSVFIVLDDPKVRLKQSPQRVCSGVMLDYDGGRVYVQNTITGDTFVYRDMPAPAINVKTLAKANARATRYLADARTEEDVISCSFIVPAAQVNDVKPGMRLEAKFTHLVNVHPDGSGYGDWTWFRVLTLTAIQSGLDRYQIDVELSPITPPEVPFAVLYRPQSADTSPGQTNPIGWICSGDPQPCSISTYGVQPTVGPLAPTPGTVSGTVGVTQYVGITFSGSGTVDFVSTWVVKTACSLQQVYVDVLINGVVVATAGVITTGGTGNPVFNVDAAGVAVSAGDVLTAQFRHAGGACLIYVEGVNETFRITGGDLS